MKVFKIVTGQPVGSRHKVYASLNCKRTDSKIFRSLGSGQPASTWRPMELYIFNPGKPKPDFFGFGLHHICNQRSYDLVGQILKQSGELLPLTVKGQEGTHYIYNCTTVLDALDTDRSVWEFFKERGTAYIEIPSFHAKRLANATLFKYSGGGLSRVYAVERSGDYRDGEFKEIVEHYKLTGLRFDLLWSDKDGPAPPKRFWDEDDPAEYRNADGKRLVYERSRWVTKLPSPTKPATSQANRKKPKEPKAKRDRTH